MKKNRKTVLVTGASQGIGYELAILFAKNNYDLILVAQNKQKLTIVAKNLNERYGSNVFPVCLNLSSKENITNLYALLQEKKISITTLVNNAGFATYGFFSDTSLQEEYDEIQVNITAVTLLTKLFLSDMQKKGEGTIINIASLAAFGPGPLMAVYYASKAYVLSFSEALANELQGSNISVTIACPGPTESGFVKRARMEKSRLFFHNVMSAQSVAEAIYQGAQEKKLYVIPGATNNIFAQVSRLLPHMITAKIARYMQKE